MAVASPSPRREPPGYQQAPHLRIIVGCGLGAVLLALFAGIVDFTLGQNPGPPPQSSSVSSVVARDFRPSSGSGHAETDRPRTVNSPAAPNSSPGTSPAAHSAGQP